MKRPFTPGPWKAKQAFLSDNGFRVFFEERGAGWVRDSRVDFDNEGGFTEANARLIAAAPELYEAVKWSLTHQDECLGDHPDQMNAFEQLLAKARGDA